jgi:uncharacterized protein (TIGR02300 family)
VAKSELGTKRICPETGRRFYDLNKNPGISPYTGHVVPVETAPSRPRPELATPVRAAAPAQEEALVPVTPDAEFVSLEEADAEAEGTKGADGDAIVGDDDIEIDEPIDDAALIEEQEESDEDVTDIIGDLEDKEEEP